MCVDVRIGTMDTLKSSAVCSISQFGNCTCSKACCLPRRNLKNRATHVHVWGVASPSPCGLAMLTASLGFLADAQGPGPLSYRMVTLVFHIPRSPFSLGQLSGVTSCILGEETGEEVGWLLRVHCVTTRDMLPQGHQLQRAIGRAWGVMRLEYTRSGVLAVPCPGD